LCSTSNKNPFLKHAVGLAALADYPDAVVVAEVAQLHLVEILVGSRAAVPAYGRTCRVGQRGRNVKADFIRWLLRATISCPA
jgi:hypothetical protein